MEAVTSNRRGVLRQMLGRDALRRELPGLACLFLGLCLPGLGQRAGFLLCAAVLGRQCRQSPGQRTALLLSGLTEEELRQAELGRLAAEAGVCLVLAAAVGIASGLWTPAAAATALPLAAAYLPAVLVGRRE